MMIICGSRSGETNVLLNLIKDQQTCIGKILLHVTDPFESKYQLLINKIETLGIKENWEIKNHWFLSSLPNYHLIFLFFRKIFIIHFYLFFSSRFLIFLWGLFAHFLFCSSEKFWYFSLAFFRSFFLFFLGNTYLSFFMHKK